ncbi:MAG: STAS/SEC14 domain-containing protein [Candidatus Eremiobacteraeota bacterium]|nr:STAS/SEC14 domain-containing protein [Candidatus Eremiobacteraeota bacterium]
MIEQLHGFPENVVAFVGHGQVAKADYISTLIPAVERALTGHDLLRLYYELGADVAGIDADAIFEDFKFGVGHVTRFERVALVTDIEWIAHAVSLFSFLIPGAMRLFATKDVDQARSWIVSN